MLIPTDIAVAVPQGTYARIAPRSGLAAKHFLSIGAEVVDADYRGNVQVLLFNHGDLDFQASKGNRIAQLLVECVVSPSVVVTTDLPTTQRGACGFGSSGISTLLPTSSVSTVDLIEEIFSQTTRKGPAKEADRALSMIEPSSPSVPTVF